MRSNAAVRTAVLGGGVIAVTYGLARFVFGMFLPAIRADMGLTPGMAGLIGALPFASYVLAILLAPAVIAGAGVRAAGVGAVAFAAAGLAAIASANGPLVLAVGVFTCGISTGLSTPVMTAAVHRAVRPALHGRVNAVINAATSLGVALATPAILWLAEAWRSAYGGFAALAAGMALAALLMLPRRGADAASAGTGGVAPPIRRGQWVALARVSLLAAAMGVVSAVYWVFAPDLAVHAGGVPVATSAWMWAAVGTGGLAGCAAGDLVQRHGLAISHAFAFTLLAASLSLLAADPANVALGLASAAAFGAAYMTLTGIYLVGGTQILPDHPALGPVVPFLAIACGQIAGSPAGGWLIAAGTHSTAFGTFGALGLAVALVSLWLCDVGPHPAGADAAAGP